MLNKTEVLEHIKIEREKARLQGFKPTEEMIRAAEKVFICMAITETIKPIVKGYQEKILREHEFKISEEWNNERQIRKEARIFNPEESYLMEDIDFKVYLKRCDEEMNKAGLKVEKAGFCPLLVAEDNERKAKRDLINVLYPFTHIRAEDLFHSSDHYNQMVELSLRLMVNYVDKEALIFQAKNGNKEACNTKTCLLEQGVGLCCNDCSLSSFEKEGVYCESKGEFILNDPLNCKGALVNAIKKDIDKRGFKNVQT